MSGRNNIKKMYSNVYRTSGRREILTCFDFLLQQSKLYLYIFDVETKRLQNVAYPAVSGVKRNKGF
jgi:hypothetical protein